MQSTAISSAGWKQFVRGAWAFCWVMVAASLGAAEPPAPAVPIPKPAEILGRLRLGHPRLLATADDFGRLKARVATEPQLRQWYAGLHRQAETLLTQPPSQYEIPDGLRLLQTSRRVLARVQTLAMIYRLEGDRRFAERAWLELETAANFKDWNPRHFLDTAEMTHTFAIGYDWLYDAWTPARREVLRQAMLEKGIRLALKIHEERRWWAVARHNWNQVCNGGIGMGALALADCDPEIAGEFLQAALKSIQLPMAEYGPDGAWAEGPGYWTYATTYNVVFLAALETALGTDFGLAQIPGFAEAGTFPIYASGPTGLSFSYADAHAGTIDAPVMFWLAQKFQRPEFAAYQLARAKGHPLDLLWHDPKSVSPAKPPVLDKHYRNSEVVTMRSAWNDPNALFVGFKAGDNKANHSHLDLGSFVLDALGVRWAEDIGADNYNLPGFFGGNRWKYYRLRAEGHNTLVFNPGPEADQDPKAAARITKFETQPARAWAVADLSGAYAKHGAKISRGIALLERRRVLVQDELSAEKPGDFWWFMHTRAQIELSAEGTVAVLTLDQKRLEARICTPGAAKFAVMAAGPLPTSPQPEGQADNREIRKLAVHLRDADDVRLAVAFTPLEDRGKTSGPAPEILPLSRW